jgi:hypothetical protein
MASVQFSKVAYTKMMLHATTNPTTQIHGILVGTNSSNITITDAIPVCHTPPTKPILDMALRITQAFIADDDTGSSQIVGWYTANERSNDDKVSPPTWKIVESIDPDNGILAIITSDSFDSLLQMKCDQDGRGRGFEVYSTQETEMPMACSSVSVEEGDWVEVANSVADACLGDGAVVYDFENQLEGGMKGLKNKSVDWLRNSHVQKLL